MSDLAQTFLIGGVLLTLAGLWLLWRSAWRSADKRKSSAQSMLGSAVFNLGVAVAIASPSIGSIDAWSTNEKAFGAWGLLLLISAGVQLGIAIERWRPQKPGANTV